MASYGSRRSSLAGVPRQLFTDGRVRRVFLTNLGTAFGGVSAAFQFVGQMYPPALPESLRLTAASAGACVLWGLWRARPGAAVRHVFGHPDITVVVAEGDLFDEPGHLVIGFCDTFDTSADDGVVVNESSVQGQLPARRYDGDVQRLDRELDRALRGVAPAATETRALKPRGKLRRYPMGTVAVLGTRPQLVFAVAYSRLSNEYVANSTAEDLWFSLNRLWDAVYRHGQLEAVSMPLIGAGLSRVGSLDEESLLRLVLLSFVTRSRERRICRELHVVLRPADLERIDIPEVEAFLGALDSAPRNQP